MSTFDDFFATISYEYRQQRDIERLKQEVSSIDDLGIYVRGLRERVDQLELLNKAMLELLLAKDVLSQDELSVMLQQIDLLDGIEDGKISPKVHARAPTCGSCGRYVNPRRSACVYCGTALGTAPAEPPRPIRVVSCSVCEGSVPERDSYYSERGVVCQSCFASLET